ncbi:MAG: hypothetical protein GWO02_20440, partial [Gammaproteobacteria bacterium]|nr:hypothetical protein [Gammaproteobacteria bacterium]
MIRDLCERIPRWVPPTLFAAALVATIAVSVAPSLPRAAGLISDKWAHTLVYGINGLLAAWAFPESRRFGLA